MANPIPARPSRQPDTAAPRSFAAQPYIIAIDAGHGGKDPGAIGPHGTKEKNVTLAIARALAKAIDDLPGMKAVLTRSDDRFIKLRQRVAIARAKHADCFISIHADSVANTRALGSSVYVVSAKGASSEAAKWLAAKENAADLAGGVSLSDQEPDVASVLLDISQSGALAGAQALAQAVLGALDEAGAAMHRTAVQRAPFAVLKAPDMPSILVETAFISNPLEEKLLRSSTYQQTLARAVRDGVLGYVAANPPADGRHWHVVRRGDTMATLATNYGVGLGAVAAANGRRLDGETTISPGEVLFIPGST
jgi:N-acetylmuramoyl-L-alanine amidase